MGGGSSVSYKEPADGYGKKYGSIEFQFIKVNNLKKTDLFGFCDPFVVISIDDRILFKTSTFFFFFFFLFSILKIYALLSVLLTLVF